MIRVTIWNEYVHEVQEETVRKIHPQGIHGTLASFLGQYPEIQVTTATLDMPECGLTDEVLDTTDVLIWWGHMAHDKVPDEIAAKVQRRVLMGMGFIGLHSAHMSKPLRLRWGTSGALQWRADEFCRMWNVNPGHPIAEGIPSDFNLGIEEMYGEYFDIPKPDDVIFISWYRSGEVFRSGCTWTRGAGKIFYLQPGHETNNSYYNENIRKILYNAVRWAAPNKIRPEIVECPFAEHSPESKCQDAE